MKEVTVTTQDLKLGDRVGSLVAVCASSSDLVEAALSRLSELPQKIILMSPFPSPSSARLRDVQGATVLSALPMGRSGQSDLISYSLPRFFSLEAPLPALRTLMPGLQEVGRTAIDCVGTDDIVALMKDLPVPLQIIIDLPGSEAEIIRAFADAAVLERAAMLELRCGVEPFFPVAQGASELIACLSVLGFVLQHKNDEDPDWPVLQFNADPVRKENRLLKTALAAAQAECDIVRAEAEGVRRESEANLTERDAKLVQMREALQQVHAELDATQAERAAAQHERDTAEQSLKSVRADLAVALRLQALAQGDLRDLQDRFAEGERQRRLQIDLLRKLAPRLLIAADQLAVMVAAPPTESPKTVMPIAPVSIRKTKKVEKTEGKRR